ncbi:MAG TPA: hypothetical protein VMV45_21065, partial [Casimicrobiaceae bacterium]|nr:hypothetical protein [Casimicrobiaceae bacterium]
MTRYALAAMLATLAIAISTAARGAQPDDPMGTVESPELSASITGSYYAMRDQSDFVVGVVAVNRGSLRFEARHNYEAQGATSAFIGWKLARGDAVTYEVTPIAGVLFGSAHAAVAGVEASIAYQSVDAYVEAEYVADRDHHADSYFYAWSELGWRPLKWLRVGIVGQRTHTVQNERDLQRGPFVQFSFAN